MLIHNLLNLHTPYTSTTKFKVKLKYNILYTCTFNKDPSKIHMPVICLTTGLTKLIQNEL